MSCLAEVYNTGGETVASLLEKVDVGRRDAGRTRRGGQRRAGRDRDGRGGAVERTCQPGLTEPERSHGGEAGDAAAEDR